MVMRYSTAARDLTPGGGGPVRRRVPYYRDDSCFDDGTGTDPGPKVHLRSGDEPRTASDGAPRRCWHPEDGLPDGSDRFYQGSIGTHGLHILFIADSDNARLTVPVTEIVAEQRMVVLPGDPGNVGERYGRGFEKPLVPVVLAYSSDRTESDTRSAPASAPRPAATSAAAHGATAAAASRRRRPPLPGARAPPRVLRQRGRLAAHRARHVRQADQGAGSFFRPATRSGRDLTNCGVPVLARTSRGLVEVGAGTATLEGARALVNVKLFSVGRRMLKARRDGLPVILHFQAAQGDGATGTSRKKVRLVRR